MGQKRIDGVVRRIRNNHGSKLVTLPPDVADAAGIEYGDYVMVEWDARLRKIVMRKVN